MDAFFGFVRGVWGKSEELGVFSVEMRAFSSHFSTPLGRIFYFYLARPLWLSPDRCISDYSKTTGLHSRQARFLIGAKATA